MGRLSLLLLLSFAGCADTGYRFERIDGDQSTTLPFKLEGFYGLRDGASVTAEARFSNGADRVTMKIMLYLRPPAEFRSGTYQGMIGGQTHSGSVECPSLTFQGGQTALPSVGGVFIFKDAQNRPAYRVRIPAATLTRPNPAPTDRAESAKSSNWAQSADSKGSTKFYQFNQSLTGSLV